MAFEGEGVRVASVQPGTGAERAGLLAGDRLLVLAGKPTPNLRALSEALRTLLPGQTVAVEFARGAERKSVQLVLGER
jgi:S1-C subfamily serine protease